MKEQRVIHPEESRNLWEHQTPKIIEISEIIGVVTAVEHSRVECLKQLKS